MYAYIPEPEADFSRPPHRRTAIRELTLGGRAPVASSVRVYAGSWLWTSENILTSRHFGE